MARVECHTCSKKFWKYRGYANENLRLGHNFYCSQKCKNQGQKKGTTFCCENPTCAKKFYRTPHEVMPHNYCSSSCAAKVNNQRYPKWPKRYCAECNKEFKNRSSDYCSNKCGRLAISKYRLDKSKYTQEQITSLINKFYKEHKRAPAKREVLEIVGCATNKFGSWTNAIIAAGLEPHRSHDRRMYKRTKTRALDGHLCDSVSEAVIDNWLHKNQIPHTRNGKYPSTNHLADWQIGEGVFIEYFGLSKDSPRYDREVEIKQQLCRKHQIKLIEIYPKDLYPANRLHEILNELK